MKEVERLRREMEMEDEELGLGGDESQENLDLDAESRSEVVEDDEVPESPPKSPSPFSADVTTTKDDDDDDMAEPAPEDDSRIEEKPKKKKATLISIPADPLTKTERKRRKTAMVDDVVATSERGSGRGTPDIPSDTETGVVVPELSKREKRRAREAKKLADKQPPQVHQKCFGLAGL